MKRGGTSIIQTADPVAVRLRHTLRALLPEATGAARSAPQDGGSRAVGRPICRRCGFQHSTQIVDGACVDLGACAKREETWR